MVKTFATFLGILVLITLALTLSCHAQNSPLDYVEAHNATRAAVGVGPIWWNDTLAAYAENYAFQRVDDCSLMTSGGPYGENLAWASDDSLTGIGAVNLWAEGGPYYNYTSNSCVDGKDCMEYTQVVWRNSVRLGCARVLCSTGGTFIICSYDPPGNVIGQRPY